VIGGRLHSRRVPILEDGTTFQVEHGFHGWFHQYFQVRVSCVCLVYVCVCVCVFGCGGLDWGFGGGVLGCVDVCVFGCVCVDLGGGGRALGGVWGVVCAFVGV
jgi:hypothetical protein